MILIIGEKPNVSKAISSAVGAKEERKGYNVGNDFVVSWCLGHLVSMGLPDEYGNGWEKKWSFSQLPMIPKKWLFKISESTKSQFYILKSLMNNEKITAIICATDADREGECIFRYVYRMAGCTKPVMRLWVSSLEESAINKALNEMKPMSEYDNLFNAGFSRAKADWLVGMNFSRLFSCRYNGTMNIGRVQTPTLAMIAERDKSINSFEKKKFFTCDLDCGEFVLSSERIDEEDKANHLVSDCNNSNLIIKNVSREIRTEKPPELYDLTSLQRDANRIFSYTAQQTLDYTQSLYEQKLCTYPRTDSRYLTDDLMSTALEITSLIDHYFGFEMTHKPNISRCINSRKVSGHHAIIPTKNIVNTDPESLPVGERNILSLIAQRLMCAGAEEHKFESVKIVGECNGCDFTANGKVILQNGWKRYIKFGKTNSDEIILPDVKEGQTFTVKSEKAIHFTSPPKSYTEGTLLSAMEHAGQEEYDENTEKKGLGTPATRASVIESLVKNGYAERKGNTIKATKKGTDLVNSVPEEVKSAKLTAEWEMKLKQIEKGEFSDTEFMNEINSFVTDMCKKYGEKSSEYSFSDNPLGKCPKCGGDVIKGKYGYYCSNKCSMAVGKVYGVELNESQIKKLLSGKPCYYTFKGKKIKILPETEETTYKGTTYTRWKTERSFKNGK